MAVNIDDLFNVSLTMTNVSGNESFAITMEAKPSSVLKTLWNVFISTALVIIMLGMGSTIEIKSLWQHIRRPVGIAIGMLSQFIVLPVVTFGLAHALQLPTKAALGMLVMGCCPGGSTSNVFTYWVDGDVPLSLSMTAVSTILSIAMLPLNLFIYSRSWTSGGLVIPYGNILISFGITVGPAAVGILLRWKAPKVADIVVKRGSVAGGLAVVLTLVFMSIMYPFMYQASWRIYLGSFLLPCVGFLFGFIVAKVFRMTGPRCRTVSLETGIQNFPLCMTLLTLTFKEERFARIALFPLMYGVTSILCSLMFLMFYRVKAAIDKKNKEGIGLEVPTIELEPDGQK